MMDKETKHSLAMSVAWTIFAIVCILLLIKERDGMRAITAGSAAIVAVLWWRTFAKQRREVTSHDEKEGS